MGSMSDSLQAIIDLHAAATPGPHFVEVIDDHTGRPEGREWLICDLAREKYGNNAVSFGEDEGTARFVAAMFTEVPVMTARLVRADELVSQMEDLLHRGEVAATDFAEAAAALRDALSNDVPGRLLEGSR